MMGGLGILFIIVFYLAITILLLATAKPIWAKLLILIIALLLPSADAVYGRHKLKQMCEAEGGLKIYRVAHDVKGFMGYDSKRFIEKYNYQFVEACPSQSYCYRRFIESGKLVKSDYVNPISKFEIKHAQTDIKKLYSRDVYSIVVFPDNGDVLATETNIHFRGGWAEQFLASFTGAGVGSVASCSSTGIDSRALILSVLKP